MNIILTSYSNLERDIQKAQQDSEQQNKCKGYFSTRAVAFKAFSLLSLAFAALCLMTSFSCLPAVIPAALLFTLAHDAATIGENYGSIRCKMRKALGNVNKTIYENTWLIKQR